MQRSDFFYDLPPQLIAQTPLTGRSQGRLLCLDGRTGALEVRVFSGLPQLHAPVDLQELNDPRYKYKPDFHADCCIELIDRGISGNGR